MTLVSHSLTHHSLSLLPNPAPFHSLSSSKHGLTSFRCAKRSQRTGKLRYPSEKKKLRQIQKKKSDDVKDKFEGFWRFSKLGVDVHEDPGKDFLGVSDALLEQIAKVLEFPVPSMLPAEAFTVVRKSFDARKLLKVPKFVYTVDMDVEKLVNLEPRVWDFISELEPEIGRVEHMPREKALGDLISILHTLREDKEGHGEVGDGIQSSSRCSIPSLQKPKVAVVGSGPAGLFAALVLGELGADVTLIERGQPVEQRGRDIGALVVRRIIQSESNFCFGEVHGAMASL